MDSAARAAFALPHPPLRRARASHAASACRRVHHQCHVFSPSSLSQSYVLRAPPGSNPPYRRLSIRALQANTLSGDSDGEVDGATPHKSYSVGVTIVSGCDPALRRNVIEKIVAESTAGRVVVVTTGGITSTDEQDGRFSSDSSSTAPSTDADDLEPSPVAANDTQNGAVFTVPADSIAPSSNISNLEGWIACSSPEEMAEVVVKLAASRECDYIVAEGATDSTIEPQELAQLLHARGGASLRVDTLVSVLDGDTVLQDLSAQTPSTVSTSDADSAPENDPNASAPEAMHDTTDSRPMLVISLVENANVIVVNQKAEAPQVDNLARVQSLLNVLNGNASIVTSTERSVPVDQLVNTNLYNHDNVLLGATWKKVLMASRRPLDGMTKQALPKSLKEATFVYRARRPFHPSRLYAHIRAVATFDGVIRSMGRIWLATRMLAPLEWNQAGVAATLRVGKLFWAAVPESDWPSEKEERERIMNDWDNQYGDRETEIVFVGMGIDKERLQGLLDGCLLQDEEMVFTNLWENFEDPFVEWVPLIDEDEEVAPEDTQQAPLEAPNLAPITPDTSETVAEDMKSIDSESLVVGEIDSSDLPEELYKRVSALDIFEKGFSDTSSNRIQQPADDGTFDADDVVVASWDGDVADGILMQMPRAGLPVTIVTGFLGSGKTTLLNYILTADHGLRIAVLVNEFGEIDIDNQLVEKGDWSSKNEVMELANGCICCNINDSFVGAVAKILERRDEIDYLIVETTGVADPVPVINSLMVADIAQDVRVDGILTLVDAENFNPSTNMGSEAALSQILAADTILLSKTDIAPEEKVERSIVYIKSIRPAARILKVQRGRVPISMILDVGLRVADSPAYLNPVQQKGRESSNVSTHQHDHEHEHDDHHDHDHAAHDHSHHDHECGPDCTDESHSHDHSHSDHLEADGFVTTSFKSDRPLDPELFMDKFLQRLPEGVFRAKGLLRFYGFGQRYIFQLSGRRYQFEEDDWPEGVAPGNQLVIIGRDLDIDSLRDTLEACHAEEKA